MPNSSLFLAAIPYTAVYSPLQDYTPTFHKSNYIVGSAQFHLYGAPISSNGCIETCRIYTVGQLRFY